MRRFRKVAIGLAGFGLAVHPLGALAAAPFGHVPLDQLASAGSDLFGIGFAAPPLFGAALLAALLARTVEQHRAQRAALVLTIAVVAVLSFVAQVAAWHGLESDAQAAVAFAILPIGVGLVGVVLGGVSFLVAAIVGRKGANAAPAEPG